MSNFFQQHFLTIQYISFFILAAGIIGAAIRVVTARNVVRSALYLVVVMVFIAGIYIMLLADFIALVQILIYAGAVIILILFALMLTKSPIGKLRTLDNKLRIPAGLAALLFFGVLSYVLWKLPWLEIKPAHQPVYQLGKEIFSNYIIPFEVVSVVLLAALIGAIVLARRD